MNHPTIKDAKDIAQKYRELGVIIFFWDGTNFGTASYGWNRELCDRMGRFSDTVMDAFREEAGKQVEGVRR